MNIYNLIYKKRTYPFTLKGLELAKQDSIKHSSNIKFNIGLIIVLGILYLRNDIEQFWLIDYLACSGTRKFVKFIIK